MQMSLEQGAPPENCAGERLATKRRKSLRFGAKSGGNFAVALSAPMLDLNKIYPAPG
jgi:hypothetical protein